jgi:hypothetical protein
MAEAELEVDRAAEERDALLAALGFKPGPFRSELSRKVILDDAAGLRPEMVKARQRADEAEVDAAMWMFIAGDRAEDLGSGLLLRLWNALKAERKERARLARLADTARLDFLDQCNRRLNQQSGSEYRWALVLNHNVNRLMLGPMAVDLHDSAANGLPSCRQAIDAAMARYGYPIGTDKVPA